MVLLADLAGWFPAPPEGGALWWYLAAMGLAVVVIGVAKAGFGGGVGILAVPLVANALPPDRAIGVMLPILIVADVFSNMHHRGNQSWPHLRWLFFGAVPGIAVGTAVLVLLGKQAPLEVALSLVVGGICLVMVALQALRMAGGYVPHVPPGPGGGAATGVLVGVASTLAHAAGPIASIYLLEQRLDKRRFVGTLVLFFWLVNVAKLPTYLWLGLITPDTLLESAWFLPLVPLGTLLGTWMHHRIPEKPFTAIIYLGAAVAAAHLVWKALT